MIHRTVLLLVATLILVLSGEARSEPTTSEVGFDARWHDGRAELDGYRYSIVRYGAKREGQAVMIFVTEPWSESKRVKVEDHLRNPADTFEVLKLNLVRDFQTGIYDYNTMVSLFVRTRDFSPVEVSFSSAEWCGHVYHKVRFDRDAVTEELRSYFEGESGDRSLKRVEPGIPEEALFVLLRGLREDYVGPKGRRDIELLSGMMESRLRHRPLAWTRARIERTSESVSVPAGTWTSAILYVVTLNDGRTGRFWVEPTGDRRILKWTWTGPGVNTESSETGELTGSFRTAYWKENGPGDDRLLRSLGLRPANP